MSSILSFSNKSRSEDRINWVSNSKEDPMAILKNLTKSLLDSLEDPSAIFDGIEMADLLI